MVWELRAAYTSSPSTQNKPGAEMKFGDGDKMGKLLRDPDGRGDIAACKCGAPLIRLLDLYQGMADPSFTTTLQTGQCDIHFLSTRKSA